MSRSRYDDLLEVKKIFSGYESTAGDWTDVERWVMQANAELRFKFINSQLVKSNSIELNKAICDYPDSSKSVEEVHKIMEERLTGEVTFEQLQRYFAAVSMRLNDMLKLVNEDIVLRDMVNGDLYYYLIKSDNMKFSSLRDLFTCGLVPSYLVDEVISVIKKVSEVCGLECEEFLRNELGSTSSEVMQKFKREQLPYLRLNIDANVSDEVREAMKYKKLYTTVYSDYYKDKVMNECMEYVVKEDIEENYVENLVHLVDDKLDDYIKSVNWLSEQRKSEIENEVAEIIDRLLWNKHTRS